MCNLCNINSGTEGLILVICRDCRVPMVVSRMHRTQFSLEEKQLIEQTFPNTKIRWTMRKIWDHAHCHIGG